MVIGIISVIKSDKNKIWFDILKICNVNFTVCYIRIKENVSYMRKNIYIKKALKYFSSRGVYQVICDEDAYMCNNLLRYKLNYYDDIYAKRVLSYMYYVLEKQDNPDLVAFVYGQRACHEILITIENLCRYSDELRIFLKNDTQSMRRRILNEYGVSLITNELPSQRPVFMICFDVPGEEFIETIHPRFILNVSGKDISGAGNLYVPKVDLVLDSVDILEGSDTNKVIMAVIEHNEATAKICKMTKRRLDNT